MKFINLKSQIFGFKIILIFPKMSRDYISRRLKLMKNVFELFLNQQRLVWNLELFQITKITFFSQKFTSGQ